MAKFQPGKSGNPKGRPRGSRNLATHFLEEVNAPAQGSAEPMSKLQAAIRAQVSKAIGGDVRAVKDMLDRVWKLEIERSAALDRAINFGDADREVIAEIHRRLAPVQPDAMEPPA